ncbi:uncharacterized protein LOC118183649 [Stegodyphus dumicola]|uniref:uncharacterized protein LOC118183649 n=1 Tax=Stegodyphus dumicola TaxID=202533 RepID=UPI0015B0B020|nr:uncharacterized protein LOC118183649 [Stegodyphus dumicola]
MRLHIKVERYRGRRGPTQCYRCQRYHHAQAACNHPPRCCKCAGDHESRDCLKPKDSETTCCNCLVKHTSKWRGCDAFPIQKPEADAIPKNEDRFVVNKSYVQAAKSGIFAEKITKAVLEAKKVMQNLQDLISLLHNSHHMITEPNLVRPQSISSYEP